MSSVHDLGGPERLQALAAEWADAVHHSLAGRGFAPGSAAYLDAANREISERLQDLRVDAPHAGALVTILMREALIGKGGAK